MQCGVQKSRLRAETHKKWFLVVGTLRSGYPRPLDHSDSRFFRKFFPLMYQRSRNNMHPLKFRVFLGPRKKLLMLAKQVANL